MKEHDEVGKFAALPGLTIEHLLAPIVHQEFCDELRKRTPTEFRDVVADLLKRFGGDLTPGPKGADGVVDLLWSTPDGVFIVQCKRWKNTVGVEVVREVFGAAMKRQVGGAFIVTTSEFTWPAKEFTIDLRIPVRLIDGKELLDLMEKHMPSFATQVLIDAGVGRCPVCGWGMKLSRAKASSPYQGKIYQLCSDECKNTFDDAPQGFTTSVTQQAEN